MLLLDIDAWRKDSGPDLETIRQVAAECLMPLTVGGSIRTLEIAHACMESGADKLCLTTAALDNPELLTQLAHTYGSQAVVLGVDIAGAESAYRLYDHRSDTSLERRNPLDWIHEGVERGAGELRIASVDREGTRDGIDVSLLQEVLDRVRIPVVIEGGAGTLDHVVEAFNAGADGVALGTMLVFSDNNLVKIKRYLSQRGQMMRIA